MESLSQEFEGRVEFLKVNIDRDEAIRERLEIESIPAYVVYRDGVEQDRLGAIPWWVEWRMRRMLEGHASGD